MEQWSGARKCKQAEGTRVGAIKPRRKEWSRARANERAGERSRRESYRAVPRRGSTVIVYRYIEHPRLRPIERKPLLPPPP